MSSALPVNWEESNACTPIKRDFLRAWFAEERRFFLTGGSALGLFYLHHRRSYDLDLFSSEAVEGIEIRNTVLRVAARIRAQCESLRTAPDYHRFRLVRGEEKEIIDVVVDRAPQIDPHKAEFDGIRVDTLREMTANKLTTLLSRAELKDIVDLYCLEQSGVDILAALPDAMAKDGGWEPAVVSMLLDGVRVHEVPAWMIRPLAVADLQAFIDRLRLALAERAIPRSSP